MVSPVVDIHTHLYPPRYMELMRERSEPPMVVRRDGKDYLLNLPEEDSGRLMDDGYWNPAAKLQYMDQSGIDISVLSLANPWLDFLSPGEAVRWAVEINDDFERLASETGDRLYTLAALPTPAGAAACAEEIRRIAGLSHVRGIILSTVGLGEGLDDPLMDHVWQALVDHDLAVFVHPHYGVGNEFYAGYGHSLYLALGFTFETTVAASKLALSGVFDRFPELKLILAHGGGTIPFLAGRINACVRHDEMLTQPVADPSTTLRRAYYDAVVYSDESLRLVVEFAGPERAAFGTDHPFSIAEAGTILSTIDAVAENDEQLALALRGANAIRLLRLS